MRRCWNERPGDVWEELWEAEAQRQVRITRPWSRCPEFPVCTRCGYEIVSPHDCQIDHCGDFRHIRECGVTTQPSVYSHWDLYGQNLRPGRMITVAVTGDVL